MMTADEILNWLDAKCNLPLYVKIEESDDDLMFCFKAVMAYQDEAINRKVIHTIQGVMRDFESLGVKHTTVFPIDGSSPYILIGKSTLDSGKIEAIGSSAMTRQQILSFIRKHIPKDVKVSQHNILKGLRYRFKYPRAVAYETRHKTLAKVREALSEHGVKAIVLTLFTGVGKKAEVVMEIHTAENGNVRSNKTKPQRIKDVEDSILDVLDTNPIIKASDLTNMMVNRVSSGDFFPALRALQRRGLIESVGITTRPRLKNGATEYNSYIIATSAVVRVGLKFERSLYSIIRKGIQTLMADAKFISPLPKKRAKAVNGRASIKRGTVVAERSRAIDNGVRSHLKK